MDRMRVAQVGTRHGHAAGKLRAMLDSSEVEVVGVYEPDADRRAEVGSEAPWDGIEWFDSMEGILADDSIVLVASEGANIESLDQTEALVDAGKHVWYDKPAGQNWAQWQRVVETARGKGTQLQMGYMFRYHEGFCQVADWIHSGFLGDVYGLRAHMSTNVGEEQRRRVGVHPGGMFYDLASHMLDQVVWMLGRPIETTSFFRNHTGIVPEFMDNTVGVFEFEKALAVIDIAAMEVRPPARRFEVYGTQGSATITEPFEPATNIRLCLAAAAGGYAEGEQNVPVNPQSRQSLYELELASLLGAIRGDHPPDRSLDHELLVQETLIRICGNL